MSKVVNSIKLIVTTFILSFIVLHSNQSFSQNRPPGRPEGKPDGRPQGRPQEQSGFAQFLSEMDNNKDGKLSILEVSGPLKDDFSSIDINNDGYITKEEFANAPKPEGEKGLDSTMLRSKPETYNSRNNKSNSAEMIPGINVNKAYFISENIIGEITTETFELEGIETLCYVIKTNSRATEHQMGPWCPSAITDGAEKGGIWFKDGKVYDVSGHFIAELDEFYSDDKWKLYREDGSIRVTNTKEGCLSAAKPDVEEAYQNYCVECLPEYFKQQVTTFVIPVTPMYQQAPQRFGRNGLGVAFNGVKFDPPAPTDAILAAHTIAPLDDHGGHVNPHGGYHYHAVTGSTKEIVQEDNHAPMIGYAIDGFGIYALLDKNENKPSDLDECGGHSDELRGYHYHAGSPGENQIINCLHGLPGYTEVKE